MTNPIGFVGLGAASVAAGPAEFSSGESILNIGENEYLHASDGRIRYCSLSGSYTVRINCTEWV